jgi:Bacterial RNA polymerase, alpha chain C terminal domain
MKDLVPWKLEANGNASRLIPRLVGFVCGFGSCGDLLIEHPQTARAQGRPGGACYARAGAKCCRRSENEQRREKHRCRPLAAERKTLRTREAEEAIAEHESVQKAFRQNRERLREERLGREAAAGPMLYPAPELPDDTPVENVRFATRIRKALHAAGMKTIGDVREVSDAALLSLPDFGSGSLSHLREALGLPSTDGVRPKIKKAT